jgi:trk system potassium uptake protein TrkH
VSSFNNAGFDIFGGFTSLQTFSGDPVIVLVTAVLIILGGISFVVLQDVLKYRRFGRLAFDSKIVLATTGALLFLGTVVILGTELLNASTLGCMAGPERLVAAFFHSVTSRTAGFSTVDTSAMAGHSLLFTMFLMFVGGAVGSTAGGTKVNTFGLLVATMVGTLRGRQHPGAFGREFTDPQVRRALTVAFLSLGLVLATTFCLSLSEGLPLLSLLFESVSAFGTVGLTTGVTPDLSLAGKLVITLTMFAGRLGPLTLVAGLLRKQMPLRYRLPTDTVRMG